MVTNQQAVAFCELYSKLMNVREAALQAGFPPDTAFECGMKILTKRKYRRLIKNIRCALDENIEDKIMGGLERLALGDCSDAVRLVLHGEEISSEDIIKMDLINVSEIKRVKGGGVEVKLFDRQKALEKMMEYAGNADRHAAAKSLLSALTGADDNGV